MFAYGYYTQNANSLTFTELSQYPHGQLSTVRYSVVLSDSRSSHTFTQDIDLTVIDCMQVAVTVTQPPQLDFTAADLEDPAFAFDVSWDDFTWDSEPVLC